MSLSGSIETLFDKTAKIKHLFEIFAKSVDKGSFLFETMFESEQLFEQMV
jgi:hypothetical protein